MALLEQEIILEELPEGSSFDLVPPGWYEATITQTELKTTKNGNGRYIKLRCDISGPTQQGRVVFTNLNIQNANSEAERIGRQQLGDLLRAAGIPRIKDSDELNGAHVQISVSVRKDKNGIYDDQNEVKKFKALEGAVPMLKQEATAPATSPAKKTATAPWSK